MTDPDFSRRFQREIAPHLQGAFNLARWLTGNPTDAEDVMQEACLKAHRFLHDLRGEDGRAWFYQIVRNTSFSVMRKRRDFADIEDHTDIAGPDPDAESLLLKKATALELRAALERLPTEFREVLVLREWEELSYGEIALVIGSPLGTVMSRLSRAKGMLRRELLHREGSRYEPRRK